MNADYGLLVFDSANSAIASQKLLSHLNVVVMPTLREVSASCGISLRLDSGLVEEAATILLGSNIDGFRIYLVRRENGKNHLEPQLFN